jgi:flagellar assembly protein FliH
MSSLLRGASVAILDHPMAGLGGSAPRIFGARVLRGDHVGLQKPMPLAVPSVAPAFGTDEPLLEVDQAAPQAPSLAEIEEAARVQGYNVGYEEGRAAAAAAAEESMAESVRRLMALAANVQESNTAFFRSAERQVVDLALQIAQKVVEKEVENMPDLAINVIRSALEEMDARTAVRVRVSPDDEELLRRRWSQCVPSGVAADRIELQADEKVQSGGAIIETTQGQVDAQLETKLAQLGNALWTFVMDVSISESDGEVTLGA